MPANSVFPDPSAEEENERPHDKAVNIKHLKIAVPHHIHEPLQHEIAGDKGGDEGEGVQRIDILRLVIACRISSPSRIMPPRLRAGMSSMKEKRRAVS